MRIIFKYIMLLCLAVIAIHLTSPTLANSEEDQYYCDSEGVPDIAIQACTRAIESENFTGLFRAILFVNRANIHQKQADFELAISDYGSALKEYPNHTSARLNRASLLERIGKEDEALQEYLKVNEMDILPQNIFDRLKTMGLVQNDRPQLPKPKPSISVTFISGGVASETKGRISIPGFDDFVSMSTYQGPTRLHGGKTDKNLLSHQQELIEFAWKICKRKFEFAKKLKFTIVNRRNHKFYAIRLNFKSSPNGGVELENNWTSIFYIEDGNCTRNVKGSY